MQAERSCSSSVALRAAVALAALVCAAAGGLAGPAPAAAQEPGENLFDTIGITRSETRQNSEIFGTPTPYSLPAEEMPPSRTVGPGPDDDADDVPLRMPDTSGEVPNLASFAGQTLELREEDQKAYSQIHFFGTTTDGGPAGGDFVLHYADDSTQTIQVRFRDWCASPNDTRGAPRRDRAAEPALPDHRRRLRALLDLPRARRCRRRQDARRP